MKFSMLAVLGMALSVIAAPLVSPETATLEERTGDKSCSGLAGTLGCVFGGIGSSDGNGNSAGDGNKGNGNNNGNGNGSGDGNGNGGNGDVKVCGPIKLDPNISVISLGDGSYRAMLTKDVVSR